MKRRIYFLLALTVLINIKSFSQTVSVEGSFLIMAICKDGIIIGGDSRLTIYNGNGKSVSYIDSIQKIFKGKNFIFGLMGLANIGDSTIAYLTNKFIDSLNKTSYSHEVLFNWHFHLTRKIPDIQEKIDKMEILTAEYKDGKPLLYYVTRPITRIKKKGFISRDSTLFNQKYSPTMSCRKAKKWIELAIIKYAEDQNKTQSIGGPIYFIKLSKRNKTKWLGAKPPKEYKTVKDILKDKHKIVNYD